MKKIDWYRFQTDLIHFKTHDTCTLYRYRHSSVFVKRHSRAVCGRKNTEQLDEGLTRTVQALVQTLVRALVQALIHALVQPLVRH